MPPLNDGQAAFAAALLNPARPFPRGLVGPDGRPSRARFAVYRNNVVAGLVETLKAAFPVVCRLVGNDFFGAMARAYIIRTLPASPILLLYGDGFADFIATFEPAGALPYLADVARLERAWVEAYHAPDARPVDPAVFTRIAPADLAELRLMLHPSLRLVRSAFPILSIWRMNIDGGVPTPIDLAAGGEDVLVVRPVADVEVRALSSGAAGFIRALVAGASIVQAMQNALADDQRFDLPGALAGLLAAGALVGYRTAPRQNPQTTEELV